jgi:hypothetical protein
METNVVPFMVVLFSGLFVLACCIFSAIDPSKRDQKLFRFKV